MSNHYTCKQIDESSIATWYQDGTSIAQIAKDLKIHPRRVRRALKSQGIDVRKPWDHLIGNDHNKKFQLTRDELDRLYTIEQKSINDIAELIGINNIRYHLIRYGIHIRGYAETRTGKGDNLSPESRQKVTDAISGSSNWNWKGGITPEDKRFYQSREWKNLAEACKQRDGFICQQCHKRFRLRRLRAHHIIFRRDGGPDTLNNLITYCNPCHRYIHTH